MSEHSHLRVLDAARAVVDDIMRLIRDYRLPSPGQLREAAKSITSNIQEGLGRDRGPDRNRFYRDSRGSAEEANEQLRSYFKEDRIPAADYWRNHNRLIVISRMLTNLMQ